LNPKNSNTKGKSYANFKGLLEASTIFSTPARTDFYQEFLTLQRKAEGISDSERKAED